MGKDLPGGYKSDHMVHHKMTRQSAEPADSQSREVGDNGMELTSTCIEPASTSTNVLANMMDLCLNQQH
jgi:hypothetical protein